MRRLKAPHGLGLLVETLTLRTYGTYVAGNFVSLIGTWMQRIGVGWLTWELTGSATWLGIVAFADLFPAVVIGPFAGVLADRMSRRRIMMVVQTVMAGHALVLFALTASGWIDAPLLALLVLVHGALVGINQPSRLALVPSLVPRDHLATAVAINSIAFNLARFIGPAAAGLVIVSLGIAPVFLANGLSFCTFILALRLIRIEEEVSSTAGSRRNSVLQDLGQGVRYIVGNRAIGPLLLLMLCLALGVRPFVELLPGFADRVFERGAPGLAWFSSMIGLGAIFGALWVSSLRGSQRLVHVVLSASLAGSLAVLAFAISTSFVLAIACVFAAGVFIAMCGIGAQTLTQLVVDGSLRGRVLSLHGIVFRSGPAAGALVMGAVSDHVGLRTALIGGVVAYLAAWLAIWRTRTRIAEAAYTRDAT